MAVTQLASGPEILVLEASFPTGAQRLFDYWTQPSLLQLWWPKQAEIQAQSGGSYHLSWPEMDWHLRGYYTTFEPAKKLIFTWKWDHDQPDAEKVVSLAFERLGENSTRMVLTHGPYAPTEVDQDLRLNHHLTGWLHFLPRLEEQISHTPSG